MRVLTLPIDILLPPICLSCKKEGSYLCDNCKNSINLYTYLVCPVCKKRNIYGTLDKRCRKESGLTKFLGAPLPYQNELVRKILHAFKYLHAKNISMPLSEMLIEFLDRNDFKKIIKKYNDNNSLMIIPIPLYNFKERSRGFNQAYEIAKYIGEYYKISIDKKVLFRRKNTQPQADIQDKNDREKNVSGAFSSKDPEAIRGKIIILLDDVYTTGATMRECAQTLRSAGAREIWGMTIARG